MGCRGFQPDSGISAAHGAEIEVTSLSNAPWWAAQTQEETVSSLRKELNAAHCTSSTMLSNVARQVEQLQENANKQYAPFVGSQNHDDVAGGRAMHSGEPSSSAIQQCEMPAESLTERRGGTGLKRVLSANEVALTQLRLLARETDPLTIENDGNGGETSMQARAAAEQSRLLGQMLESALALAMESEVDRQAMQAELLTLRERDEVSRELLNRERQRPTETQRQQFKSSLAILCAELRNVENAWHRDSRSLAETRRALAESQSRVAAVQKEAEERVQALSRQHRRCQEELAALQRRDYEATQAAKKAREAASRNESTLRECAAQLSRLREERTQLRSALQLAQMQLGTAHQALANRSVDAGKLNAAALAADLAKLQSTLMRR